MNEKLKQDIIEILEYFDNGLADVESGSGEKQPMHKEIKSALRRMNNLKTLNKGAIKKSVCFCEQHTEHIDTNGIRRCDWCGEPIKQTVL